MRAVRSILSGLLDSEVTALWPLGGGDVADSYQAVLDNGDRVFAKTKRGAPPGFFITEAAGLAWLREAARIGHGRRQ